MKKILFLSVAICALNAYELSFEEVFSKNLKPEELVAYIKIQSHGKTNSQVSKNLEQYLNIFKEEKNIKLEEGSYSINPKYNYEKNKSIFLGYLGEVSYKIKSKNINEMNDFLSNFSKLTDTNKSKINISSMRWEVSDEGYKSAQNELKIQAFLWGKNNAEILTKKLNDKCELENVSISSTQQYYPRVANYATNYQDSNMHVALEQTDKQINITANYRFLCK